VTPPAASRRLADRIAAAEERRHVTGWTFTTDEGGTFSVPMRDALSVIGLVRDLEPGQQPPPLLLRMARVVGDTEGSVIAGALGQLARYALNGGHDQEETAAC
jgi:hypothetical protein